MYKKYLSHRSDPVVTAFPPVALAERIAGAKTGKIIIDKTVLQMFVAPLGYAHARGFDNSVRLPDRVRVVEIKTLAVKLLLIPVADFDRHGLTQQGLSTTEFP